MPEQPAPTRRERRRAAVERAAEFDGVLTLRRLSRLGYDHAAIAREVDNDRWMRLGTHTVALHTGAVGEAARRWTAVGGRRGRRPRRRRLGATRRRPHRVHGGAGPRLRASWCSVPPGR